MRISKKVQEMAVFIEFLTGAGLAILFHRVLHYPEAAYSIFGIGILLSLATYLLREDIERNHGDLTAQYHQAHEITFAIAGISDQECHAKAQEVLSGTKRTISLLQQGFIPLDETEFYLESAKCSDQAQQRIKTVAPLTPGWHTRGSLVNLYQSNLRAIVKGVAVTRVFVIDHDALTDPDARKILLSQHWDGIEVRIAFRDECPASSDISDRDTTSSFDFAIYDDHIATEVFPQNGKFFGRKTGLSSNVDKFLRLYELIEHSSHAITVENDKIVLASEAYKLAA
jgi:hypothetical protein